MMCDPGENLEELSPVELQAALIRQEHRLFHILRNFFIVRPKLPDSDPRREASWSALLFRIASPGTVAVTTGGLMATLTLVLGIYSALIVRTQTSILERQTNLLREQNLLAEASRRASLNFELTSILDEIDEEMDELGFQRAADFRGGSVTTADFSKPLVGANSQTGSEDTVWLPPNLEPDPEAPRANSLRAGSDIGARLRWRDRSEPLRLKLSDRLQGRIAALSRSFRPYIFLTDNGAPSERPLSPERGQLLLALAQAGVDMEDLNHSSVTFASSYLEDVDIRGSQASMIDLRRTDLQRAHLRRSTFQVDLTDSQLDFADLQGSELYGKLSGRFYRANLTSVKLAGDLSSADFCGADLTNVDLMSADNWVNANFRLAYVGKLRKSPEGFLDWALDNGALSERPAWEEEAEEFTDAKCYPELRVSTDEGSHNK